jgi:hypothetical protein
LKKIDIEFIDDFQYSCQNSITLGYCTHSVPVPASLLIIRHTPDGLLARNHPAGCHFSSPHHSGGYLSLLPLEALNEGSLNFQSTRHMVEMNQPDRFISTIHPQSEKCDFHFTYKINRW